MTRSKFLAAPMLSIALIAATIAGGSAIVMPTAAVAESHDWKRDWKRDRHHDYRRDDRRDDRRRGEYRDGYREGYREAQRNAERGYYDSRDRRYYRDHRSDNNSDAATVMRLIQQFSN